MSDVPQGPGWWQASDGRYYPPEQFPGAAPTPQEAPPAQPPAPAGPPPPGAVAGSPPPPGAVAGGPPPPGAVAGGAPPPTYGAPAPSKGSSGCVKALIVVAVIVAILGVASFALVAWVIDRGVDEIEDYAGDVERQQEIIDETGIQTSSTNTENPPQYDIELGSCDVAPGAGSGEVEFAATGAIENHSSKTSDYWVVLSFRDDGIDVAEDIVTLSNVDPDQVIDWTASGVAFDVTGEATCKIVRIERWEAGLSPPDVVGS